MGERVDALQLRGAKVWLDKDEIRPGDRFVRALENGLETSKAVALVVTPESVSSGWVEDEYSRALSLSNERRLQLIPVLLRDARQPGFLANRQSVDFREASKFDQAVDRLIWPGITGKQVIWYPVYGVYRSERWKRLTSVAAREGIEILEGEDIHRSEWFLRPILEDTSKRLVLVFDIFEERPAAKRIWRNTTGDYIEVIFRYRRATKGQANEIAFLLYHQHDAWGCFDEAIEPGVVKRLEHFFTIHQDLPDPEFQASLRNTWNRIQRDLMMAEHA